MKLMPASRAFATIRLEVASSVGPPNIMVPRQIGEIFRPLRPRLRYCMGQFPCSRDRHCEERSDEAIQTFSSAMDCFAALAMTGVPSIVLQYLKHAVGHGDTALVDGHLGADENQAAGRADHARLRDQSLADLAGLDKMSVELNGRE